MSRSWRKTPIFGNAHVRSERWDKQQWHRRMRVSERTALAKSLATDPEAHLMSTTLEVSNTSGMAKDGRHYISRMRQEEIAGWVAGRWGATGREFEARRGRALAKLRTK
jgi:hypothetical protein